MIAVIGSNAINLENVSRLSLAVSNRYGWKIEVTFDNPTKYYLGFTVVDEKKLIPKYVIWSKT